jgi:hypothetical protein
LLRLKIKIKIIVGKDKKSIALRLDKICGLLAWPAKLTKKVHTDR